MCVCARSAPQLDLRARKEKKNKHKSKTQKKHRLGVWKNVKESTEASSIVWSEGVAWGCRAREKKIYKHAPARLARTEGLGFRV